MKIFFSISDIISKNPEAIKTIVEKCYFVDKSVTDVSFAGEGLSVDYKEISVSEEFLRTEISLLIDSTIQSFKRSRIDVLFENNVEPNFYEDPHPELIRTKQLLPTSSGQYAYQGNLLRLIRALDKLVFTIALENKAIEQEYPTRIAIETLTRCGYLSEFPQHAFICTTVDPTLNKLNSFASKVRLGLNQSAEQELSAFLDHPTSVLAPTVCYHCFESLKDSKLLSGNRTFTAISKCHRHEYKSFSGLERLQTFTMREIIFFGSPAHVDELKKTLTNISWKEILKMGLKARVVNANDPFFTNEASKKRAYQDLLGLKQELQVYLPYLKKWIAIGSFNNHRNTLVKSFDIQANDEVELNSGCVGYGLERWALSIISQFGTDASRWPIQI